MAITTLVTQKPKKAGAGAPGANSLDIAYLPVDVTDGGRFLHSGNVVVLTRNKHATLARNASILGGNCSHGRAGNVTDYSVGALEFAAKQLETTEGWVDATGHTLLDGESTDVEFAILDLT